MIVFGTLGAADITPQALIHPCVNEPQARVGVIAARDRSKADGFARFQGIPKVVDDYYHVVDHADCNAIYNPLPISHHKQWSIKSLEAGKHVLCEKSLACNAEEAQAMVDVADAQKLILMDAFHYRYHPLFIAAKAIYTSGKLGAIKSISAAFAIGNTPSADDIRMNFETAGGVTMDIGCYPISWIRHLTDLEPEVLSATAEVGPPNVDLMLAAEFQLEGGVNASIMGDMRPTGKFRADIVVVGENGTMTVKNPLAPQMGHLIRTNIEGVIDNITVDRRPSYSYQLDAFIEAIHTGAAPITNGHDAVKQMQVIDRCYELAGLPKRGS